MGKLASGKHLRFAKGKVYELHLPNHDGSENLWFFCAFIKTYKNRRFFCRWQTVERKTHSISYSNGAESNALDFDTGEVSDSGDINFDIIMINPKYDEFVRKQYAVRPGTTKTKGSTDQCFVYKGEIVTKLEKAIDDSTKDIDIGDTFDEYTFDEEMEEEQELESVRTLPASVTHVATDGPSSSKKVPVLQTLEMHRIPHRK